MLTIAYYLLKVMLSAALLFVYYWVALRNKKFHRYNRFYLLSSLIVSWLIPLIKISFWKETSHPAPMVRLLSVVATGDHFVERVALQTGASYNWNTIITVTFLFVCAGFLSRLLLNVVKINRVINRSIVEEWNRIYLVYTDIKGSPFSYFKYIFWNKNIDVSTREGEHIFKHELAHVQEKHSADKLFVNLILIVSWYNPFTWLIRNELNMIHEFIADEKAFSDGDLSLFASAIIKSAYPAHSILLTNSFFLFTN